MNFRNTLTLIGFLSIIIACGSKTSFNSLHYKLKKQPNHFYFSILQLNDIFEIDPVGEEKKGGLARIETIKKILLKDNPNTFIVLAGNFLNPSSLSDVIYQGDKLQGKPIIDIFNKMNIDLATFGSSDFGISYKNLQERINESNFDWVSSNILHKKNGQAHYFHKVKEGKKQSLFDTYIKEFYYEGKSLKVGFLSVSQLINEVDFAFSGDLFIESERAYNELKNKVDIVLAITNTSNQNNNKLAEMFPDIPLIISGGSNNFVNNTVSDVKITKSDINAKNVFVHRFDYDLVTKKIILKSELISVDNSIPEDQEIKFTVSNWLKLKVAP